MVMVHVAAAIAYVGGGFLLHVSVRRAVARISPGQAAIVSSRIGNDFTIISWIALAAWGITGYWLLDRFGMLVVDSPHTLFIRSAFLRSPTGKATLVMVAAWYVLVANASLITFAFRPRLQRRLAPDADISSEVIDEIQRDILFGARGIGVLALVNLIVAIVAFVAAKLYY